MLTGLRTLVLNANYMPVSVFPLESIPAEDAVTRILNGTCHAVFEYDRKILTPNLEMCWPSVIARNDLDKINNKAVKLKRETLFYRDHGLCAYCEKPLVLGEVTYDHIRPQSMGGPHTWENVVASCGACNSRKGSHLPVGQWKPKHRAYKPDYWQLVSLRKKFPITIPNEDWVQFLGDWDAEVRVAAYAATHLARVAER
jgi:5-methylcytosine-specific restriction endonuclease McrA